MYDLTLIYPKDAQSESSDVSTKGIVDKSKRKCGDSVKVIFVLVDEANEEMFEDVLGTDIPQSLESLAIASETDPASPITSSSGSLPRRSTSPRRTTSWSSTKKTFTICDPPWLTVRHHVESSGSASSIMAYAGQSRSSTLPASLWRAGRVAAAGTRL